ncbi:PDDEXK nuclease domain-containing protein [Edaphobacter aggregans]|uniref:PDDEXK nuclease domain-containing protein n=1 Tax=Edaphobacter aggregans TaxID=570835 RepID=UPI00391830F8
MRRCIATFLVGGYLVDFLDLPDTQNEADLQKGLLFNLRKFLMELGDGFAFVGEKVVYRLATRISNWIYSSPSRLAVLGCLRTKNGSLRTRAYG